MNHDVDDDNKNKWHRLLLAAVAASFFSFFSREEIDFRK